ncbi:SMODS domain-containing nucleotidyltransferase, partial [Enterococcus avium]
MGNSSYFTNLLTNIELSKTTKSYVSSLQSNLRDYLKNHIEYKTKHIDTFLSGSYAKNTSIRPSLNEENQDVDIVVLTNYTRDTPPVQVLNELKSVLKNNSKYKEVKLQSKSIGIEMANYHIDVVPIVKEA